MAGMSRRQSNGVRKSDRARLVAELTHAVRVAGRHTVFFHEAMAHRLGLGAADSRALSFLQETGPVPAGRLAELTGLTSGAVTGMIDRLERAGLVRREHDPEDRRRVIVAPVDDPSRAPAAERLFAPLGAAFARLVERYTDAELATIVDFVARASAVLRDRTTTEATAGSEGPAAGPARTRRPSSGRKSR